MFDTEIATSARLYNVPETWVRAVIETESSWKPNAFRAEPKINDASYGLMQLLYRTAQNLGYTGTRDGLYDPIVNIDLGTKLLGQLRALYGDDFQRVYSAYNSGSPDRWLTSTEVGRNVSRAVDNLSKWISAGVSQFTAAPESSPLVGLLILVFLWAWTNKRR